jgi:hypothetical protein
MRGHNQLRNLQVDGVSPLVLASEVADERGVPCKYLETIPYLRRHIRSITVRQIRGAVIMDYKQLARTISLAALIVSPMIALLAMQLPLWLSPTPVALERVVRAEFTAPWIDRDPASLAESWAETVAPECKLPPPYDNFCRVVGAGWLLK